MVNLVLENHAVGFWESVGEEAGVPRLFVNGDGIKVWFVLGFLFLLFRFIQMLEGMKDMKTGDPCEICSPVMHGMTFFWHLRDTFGFM
jgi:hypothetical protein